MARTHKNIFDWLKPGLTNNEAGTSTGLEEDHVTGTEENWLREQRLELVRMRQTVWSTTRMCRELLLDVMRRMDFTRIKPSEESVVVKPTQTIMVVCTHRCPEHLPLPKRVWTWAG